jgi:hypothetical protein
MELNATPEIVNYDQNTRRDLVHFSIGQRDWRGRGRCGGRCGSD